VKVYVVLGGCPGDLHIIAIYRSASMAQDRALQENKTCRGLNAYFEEWRVLG